MLSQKLQPSLVLVSSLSVDTVSNNAHTMATLHRDVPGVQSILLFILHTLTSHCARTTGYNTLNALGETIGLSQRMSQQEKHRQVFLFQGPHIVCAAMAHWDP